MDRYRTSFSKHIAILVCLVATVVSACGETPAASPLPTTTPPPPATLPPATATPAVTPSQPQQLVLCSTEPNFISPFLPTQAGNDLLALYYEEPVERVGHRWEPRLVTHLPSVESGDVITRRVAVASGGRYADEVGAVQVHEGAGPLRLTQLVVTFTLQADLRWSNGEPLTAEDAVLGYHLAQAPQTQDRWRELVERTARFVAVDAQTLRWEGIPGYLSADYPGFLFPPQPSHRWQGRTLVEVAQDRTPPGTGPYKIVAWEAGREVRLERNLYYSGPEPVMEAVVFRFPQVMPTSWTNLLLTGQCDVLLPDPVMSTDLRQWDALKQQGRAMVWADAAPVVLRLDFNLDPQDGEPSPLADVRVRQGLAQCLDRSRLSQTLPGDALIPAYGFIPPGHPAYSAEAAAEAITDPVMGSALLDQAGWRDEDEDGIREAHDVTGFREGEPMSLTMHMAPQYFTVAAYVAAGLEMCGVGVRPETTEPQLLYANDPVSPLFGRTFDIALVGWWAELPQMCGVWRSNRVPEESNRWSGENFSGYTSEVYDAACQRALTALDFDAQTSALREAQSLLLDDAPTLFLAWRPFWFVARPQVQGLKPDVSTYGTLWNIEEIRITE